MPVFLRDLFPNPRARSALDWGTKRSAIISETNRVSGFWTRLKVRTDGKLARHHNNAFVVLDWLEGAGLADIASAALAGSHCSSLLFCFWRLENIRVRNALRVHLIGAIAYEPDRFGAAGLVLALDDALHLLSATLTASVFKRHVMRHAPA